MTIELNYHNFVDENKLNSAELVAFKHFLGIERIRHLEDIKQIETTLLRLSQPQPA